MVQIVTEPKIYVIASMKLRPLVIMQYLADQDATWKRDIPLDGTRDLELLTEFMGRLCYAAFGRAQYRTENADYVENLLSSKHGSVVEHPVISMVITGVSRTLTHELIRHRVGVAYSQRSQRYVDEKQAKLVAPPLLAGDHDRLSEWALLAERSMDAYLQLAASVDGHVADEHPHRKVRERRIMSKQTARSLLPNAAETQIGVTANVRALRHICETRGGVGAEAEIRRLAVKLAEVGREEAPNLFADLSVGVLEDGELGVKLAYSKV